MRHAESTYNKYRHLQINCDITEEAKIKCSYIEGEYDLIICSSLKRAINTLYYSNIKYKELIITDLCREFKISICDFLENEPINYETLDNLYQRIDKFRTLLLKKSLKYQKILVISHTIFIKKMCKIKKILNCEITQYIIL
jgi:broad specificity phosphatase PhoE